MARKIAVLGDYIMVPSGKPNTLRFEPPNGRPQDAPTKDFDFIVSRRPEGKVTMPMFTTRHYEAFADALKAARLKLDKHETQEGDEVDYTFLTVAATVAAVFRKDNPKFDTSKFLKRIGIK